MEKANYLRLRIIFLVSIVFLIALSIFSYIRTNSLIEKSKLVNHSNVVKLEVERCFSVLKDAQSNQRAFIITRDSLFLSVYQNNLRDIDLSLNRIDTLAKDNPIQLQHAIEFRKLVYKRIDPSKRAHLNMD